MADFTVVNSYMLPDTWYAVTAAPSTVSATLDDVSVSLEHNFSGQTLFFKTPAAEGVLVISVIPLPWAGDTADPGNSNLDLTFVLSEEYGIAGRALFIMLKHRAVSQMTLTIATASENPIDVVPRYDDDGQYYYYILDIGIFKQTNIMCTWTALSKGTLTVTTQHYTTTYVPEGQSEGVMLSWTHDPFEYSGRITGYSIWRDTTHLGIVVGCEYLDRQITDTYRMAAHTYRVFPVGRGTTSGMNPYTRLGMLREDEVTIQMSQVPMCLLSGTVNNFCYAEIEFDPQVIGEQMLGGSVIVPVINGKINKYLPQGAVCTLRVQSLGIAIRFAVPETPLIALQTVLQ